MDVLSPQQYYRRRVLYLSRENTLVRYAACAVAAKQLGHIRKPWRLTEGLLPPCVLTHTASDGSIDFLWYGAKYYGKAIQAMAAELSCQTSPGFGSSPDQLPWESSFPSPLTVSNEGGLASEARLAAAEIMCYYEELSGSWRAWGRHLNGILRLLQSNPTEYQRSARSLAEEEAVAISEPSVRSLWLFVYNDFQQSCESRSLRRRQRSTDLAKLSRRPPLVTRTPTNQTLGPMRMRTALTKPPMSIPTRADSRWMLDCELSAPSCG